MAVFGVTGALLQPAAAGASQGPPPQVRVDQVGYPSSAPKAAYVMLPPGQKAPPNLAGRFAADFALGAQQAAGTDPASAAHLLSLARGVYAMARTTKVGQLVTAFPHDFYPATQWKSDMLWGAAEIALADEAAGAQGARVRADLSAAARWARAYIAQGHDDTFNLYDTGAMAEAELIQAMRQAGAFPVSPGTLLGDMAAQLRAGQAQAKSDPFALGSQLGNSDASPHAFGTVDGMRACSAGRFAPFNTKTAAYEDNVVSWPSVEPADDYTANSLMAFALGAAGLG